MFRIARALLYGAAHSGKLGFPVTMPHLHHFASTSFVSLQEQYLPCIPSLGPDPFTRGNTGPDPKRLSLSRSGHIAGLDTLLCIEGYKVSCKTCHASLGSSPETQESYASSPFVELPRSGPFSRR